MTARQCKARSKRSGKQCRRVPAEGAEVCATHGGNAPQVKQAATQRAAMERARETATTYGVPVEIDPAEGLLDEVARTAWSTTGF